MYEVPNRCKMMGEIYKMQLKISPIEFAKLIIHIICACGIG